MPARTIAQAASENDPPAGSAARIVKTLAPWHQLLTMAVFLGGGLVWVAGYFATKQQVDNLKCYAKESVALARAEASIRFTMDEILSKSGRAEQLVERVQSALITDAERQELRRLQREIKDLDDSRDKSKARLRQAEEALIDEVCTKEK